MIIKKILYIIIVLIVAAALIYFLVNYFINKKTSDPVAEKKLFEEAQTLFKEKKYTETVQKYQELLENYPKSELKDETLLSLGLAYMNLREYDRGISTFKVFINEYPENENISLALYQTAMAYLAKNDVDKAKTFLDIVVEGFPEKEKYIKDAKSLSDQISGPLLFREAEFYFNQGILEQAIDKYKSFIKDYPTTGSTYDKSLFSIAVANSNLGNFNEAISYFERLIDERPESLYAPDSLYFSAEIYNKQNNIEKAKIYCDKILNEYPNTRQWIIDKAKQCFDLNETNT